jgi:serum/glucocorticoid-regulated kinase 2
MPETLHKSESNDGTGDQTGPGILTVKLGWAYGLSLPDDPGAEDEVCERWRPYAIGEYEGLQLSTEAMAVYAAKGAVSWAAGHRPFKFDVSASLASELTVSLFVRDSDSDASTSSSGEYENQIIPLGLIRLNPFLIGSGKQTVDVQDGTGRVEVEVSYTHKEVSPLETQEVWSVRGENSSGDLDLIYVEKKDTGRSYGMKAVDIRTVQAVAAPGSDADTDVNMAPSLSVHSAIQHPFIAPLKFALRSSEGTLHLLSPLASGGYLFDHLQRERQFNVHVARFYAADLVCILEYLHDKHIILNSLEPENILLDSSGHVSLCKPGLFGLKLGDGVHILPGTPKCPAPEALLDDREASPAADWWALGIILYEMLMGMPPFYHKDAGKRRHKIINQDLQLLESLPSTARDILTKLLDKDPKERLGANGAAEVKAHPFFHAVTWHECLQRKYTTPFKPHDAAVIFWREPCIYQPFKRPEREQREFEGEVYEQIGTTEFPLWIPIGSVNDQGKSHAADKNASDSQDRGDDDGWELTWEPTKQEFYFKNRFTDERVTAKPEAGGEDKTLPPAVGHPSERQKEETLAAALKAGYSQHLFSEILRYSTNLNVRILDYDQTPDGIGIRPDTRDIIPVTPLEWAVEHERLDLVNLFLENGADANFTISPRDGPALLKAVKRKSQRLLEILVQKTDRVSCTRALALAVEQQDIMTANTLLAHRVRCDFEESDRPLPPHPFFGDYDSNLSRGLEVEDLTPPLVRAARLGNVALVALLLEHGADANAAYHDLGGRRDGYETRDSTIPANFSCGRVVQTAMEMGHSEIVHLLVDAGADINLTHPVWPKPVWPVPGHICQPVPRAVYVEVRAGLEAAVAARRGQSLAKNPN